MNKGKLLAWLYITLIFLGTVKVYLLQTTHTAAMPVEKKHIVLDAGHGGFDPGKVAADGTEEKNVNLEIMRFLQGYLEQGGAVVTVTRSTDEALAQGKNSDLKSRLMTVDGKADLFVSIHQNSYPSPNVKGAQVFYYKNSEQGKALASAVQSRLKEVVDVENDRSAKPNGSYYILKNSSVPSVIVECGFLSSPEENEKLKDSDYQKKIAWAIYMGIVDYFSQPNV